MKHPYRIREIAAQAGLSQATVDRVLHGRGGVRESTVREVRQAIADLDHQKSQVRLGGRTFTVDVVVQAPPRFSTAVKAALEAELPTLRAAVIRSRFHLFDGPADLASALAKIGRSGSHGVLLKAPDVPEVVDAVGRLGIPVVTLVTDLPTSRRVAYVDDENTTLLRTHRLSAVLHHDLRADLRHACLAVMRAQGALSGPVRSNPPPSR